MQSITKILLSIEDRARRYFAHIPFVQAFLAGIGVIIFWRGVWELLDMIGVTPVTSIVIGSLILGGVGVFIQTFIGNSIIIKNVEKEVQSEKKTLRTIAGGENVQTVTLQNLSDKIDFLIQKIEQK